MCNEISNFLNRLVTDPATPPDVRRQIIEAMVREAGGRGPTFASTASIAASAATMAWQPPQLNAVAASRKIVFVHGICRHIAGYSDLMWHALQPFASDVFGAAILGQTRLEVLWSDLVNQALAVSSASAGLVPGNVSNEQNRQQAAAEIRETLRDRADQHALQAAAAAGPNAAGVAPVDTMSQLISIPGFDCVDDFSVYLTDDFVRQQIINRFTSVVGPQLSSGVELDIISHSWGTVVAYEGLRELADRGIAAPLVRNFFTVGAALSIGPVKSRLRSANRNGSKPASVRRWINLDARGDWVGGPLKGRPYQVDLDFVNLDPTGCGSFLGAVSPVCAHGSYFVDANVTVNRDIFSRYIHQA